jgi:hypothetical protein
VPLSAIRKYHMTRPGFEPGPLIIFSWHVLSFCLKEEREQKVLFIPDIIYLHYSGIQTIYSKEQYAFTA